MSEVSKQKELKRYLLGDIASEEERLPIEERLLTDESYFEESQVIEEELYQEYADDTMDSSERTKFEERFLTTEEGRRKLRFARNLRERINKEKENNATEPQKKPSLFERLAAFFTSPIPALVAVLVIAGALGIGYWRYYNQPSEITLLLNKDQEKRNVRSTVGRISEFAYASPEGTRSVAKQRESLEFLAAKAKATNWAAQNPTAENRYELGRVLLAGGEFDEAIKQFEEAVKLNSKIAKLRNDLGVAYMEMGKTIDEKGEAICDFDKCSRALEEFSKAIELDVSLGEAKFNKARCLSFLGYTSNEEREAWEEYLKFDSNSKWADEAREHLKSIGFGEQTSINKDELLDQFSYAKKERNDERAWKIFSANKEMGSGKLIPLQLTIGFLNSFQQSKDDEAKETLGSLMYLADLEQRKSGDAFWQELAYFYQAYGKKRSSQLNFAYKKYNEGLRLRATSNYEDSMRSFSEAQALFERIGSRPEALIANYWRAYSLFQLGRIGESNQVFEKLIRLGKAESFHWIVVISLIRLAYASESKNNYIGALQFGTEAFNYIDKTNDTYNLNRAFTILAQNNSDLGQYPVAMEYCEKSLKLHKSENSSVGQKWLDFETTMRLLRAQKRENAAIVFQREALKMAQESNDNHNEQISLAYLAQMYMDKGDYRLANEFIDRSFEAAAKLPSEQTRQRTLAYSKLLKGSLKKLEGQHIDALTNLNEASSFYDNSEYQLRKYDTHLEKLLILSELRDDAAIQSEIDIILDILREYRRDIREDQKRTVFFVQKQNVYDLAIEYKYKKNDLRTAFSYSEESRSRSLLAILGSETDLPGSVKETEYPNGSGSLPLTTIDQIQEEMPEDVQIVEYVVLKDKILIWHISKDDWVVKQSDVALEALQQKVSDYYDLISQNNSENEKQIVLAKELHQILIAPIEKSLMPGREICFIPDKSLANLSFSAIYSEKYLIEDYPISYAPSAKLFLWMTKEARERGRSNEESILSIGNPRFDQEAYPKLKTLPYAAAEAKEVAGRYPRATVLQPNEATKERVLGQLGENDVFHFAGHYLVNEFSSQDSGFVLAGSGNEASILFNRTLETKGFRKTRLVILSACQTGAEKHYEGEGMIGASRTFLAKGVPVVVASQWAVDSQATKELMISFHEFRRANGLNTADALRSAQLQMLKSGQYTQPFYWAAFIKLGGYAKY